VVGDNVTLGTGCKILGGILIGNNAIVGANAVVVHSVEAFARVKAPQSVVKLQEDQ
jgi:serine acetyltransferase